MKKILFLFTLLFCITGFAQQKNYVKAEKAFNSGNLKAANKFIDKCLLDKETKDNPNTLLLKSKVMLGISKDPKLFQKYSTAMKDAVKYAEKALEANPSPAAMSAFKTKHLEYYTQLVKLNNKEAIDNYNAGKYARALPMFKKSIFIGLDTQSLVLGADCYWQLQQYTESVELFKIAANMIYAAVLDSNSQVYSYYREPFRKLGQHYIEMKAYDSAYIVVKNGREILPNDPLLNSYTYELMRYTLDRIPPSGDYLRAVQNGLRDFPDDSFLNHKENSIYIYLLNGMALANEQNQFDSLLKIYAQSKTAKSSLKKINMVKRFDIFAGLDNATFISKLKYYFKDIGLKEACYATWKTQMNMAKNDETASLNQLLAEENIQTAAYIFERILDLNPKNNLYIKGRQTYVQKMNKTDVAYYGLYPLIELNLVCSTEQAKNNEFKNYAKTFRLRLISEAADSNDFKLSRRIWHDSKTSYADQNKTLDMLWRKMVEQDFRMNYFGSRINNAGKTEANIPTFSWDGNADSCLAGSMSFDVVLRLERRINYFRRMAGVSEEIVLSIQDNEYCRYAAMMCEANKSMSHEPSDGWRCFIPAGLDALKNSILSKDGNPSIAITAAMGQNHPTVGNRRWLLYPYAEYMGIGTSRTYTAIKAVDNSRDLDSVKYKNQSICWPPAGDSPKMLAFKKWSFSQDIKLEGATVSMTDANGKNVELKQEALSLGYGLNTLVWEPQINVNALEGDIQFTVTIRLKNGQTISYKVKLIHVSLN